MDIPDINSVVFKNKWTFWIHEVDNQNWEVDSYIKLIEITNPIDFLKIFNNIHLINYKKYHYFIMKNDILPLWENNITCMLYSLKIIINESLDLFQELCLKTMIEQISFNKEFINIHGISISPKTNWSIIKIWNNSSKDISNDIISSLSPKYANLNIILSSSSQKYSSLDQKKN